MNGYQLTFLMGQNQRHEDKPLGKWLLKFAKDHGARGATLVAASERLDHLGHSHSAHFVDLADQPLCLTVSKDEPVCKESVEAVDQEPIDVAFVKVPVEFGRVGTARKQ